MPEFKVEYLTKGCILKETILEADSAISAKKSLSRLTDFDSVISCVQITPDEDFD